MLVPAPGLFSITTCSPQILDSRSAAMRATVSVDPPGAYGTTTRTGRVGQAWANVGRWTGGASANVGARATRRRGEPASDVWFRQARQSFCDDLSDRRAGHSHLQGACKRQADHDEGAGQHTDRD